jgi:hypothetical protein
VDLRVVFDRLVEASGRASALMHYGDLVREAKATDRRECGACQHWMKKPNCPREGGIGSQKGGPSCGAPPCHLFSIEPWIVELKEKRLREAEEYADRVGIPAASRI